MKQYLEKGGKVINDNKNLIHWKEKKKKKESVVHILLKIFQIRRRERDSLVISSALNS